MLVQPRVTEARACATIARVRTRWAAAGIAAVGIAAAVLGACGRTSHDAGLFSTTSPSGTGGFAGEGGGQLRPVRDAGELRRRGRRRSLRIAAHGLARKY